MNVAVEKHYNSVPGENEELDTSPEILLTQYIDTPIAGVLRKIDNGTKLGPEDSARLAIFVVFQFYRSPKNKEQVKRVATDEFQKALGDLMVDQAVVEKAAEESGVFLTEEELGKLPDLVRAGEIAAEATNVPWLAYSFDAAKRIAPHLVAMRTWTLCTGPPGFEFITSDNPVQQFFFEQHGRKLDLDVWTSPETMTVLPIDPMKCIVIHGLEGWPLQRQLDRTQAHAINRAMIVGSSRMVFSRRNERFIGTILEKDRAIAEEADSAG